MIKCDFHIHTQATLWDAPFEFDIDELDDFVKSNELDCIAITNHNIFIKSNFDEIKEHFDKIDVSVFPGIEVSVKSGHIIVIGDISDESKIEQCSDGLKQFNLGKEDSISIDEFNRLFCDRDFLIIPHYKKDPSLSVNDISLIKDKIYAGEVCNTKKFYLAKNHIIEDKIVPVLFSDHRCHLKAVQETRYTYIDSNTKSFREICLKLRSPDNVFLSARKDTSFDVLSGNVVALNGINVLLGKRSSGKTFTLNNIFDSGLPSSKNILYIEQFAISKECDDKSFTKFNDDCLEASKSGSLTAFGKLFEKLNNLECESNFEDLSNYITSLKKNAEENVKDEFSKTHVFNENLFDVPSVDDTQEMIKSIECLINSYDAFSKTFVKYITKEKLIALRTDFLKIDKKVRIEKIKKEYINSVLSLIKEKLAGKSGATIISEINFEKIFRIAIFKNKFNNLISKLKEKEVVNQEIADKFVRKITLRPYKNWSEFKSGCEIKCDKDEYTKYIINDKTRDPFQFWYSLYSRSVNDGVKKDFSSCFITFDQYITSKFGNNLSGGERAEYILLEKLSMYQNYDIVLIDEMESSFDNPFLNTTINNLIHRMAKSCIVFISTHNNNIGVSLKPDNFIYHKVNIDNEGKKTFVQYYGKGPTLFSKDGRKIGLKEVLLETMEASDSAYEERSKYYEIS